MTQLKQAKNGIITNEMKQVAETEGIESSKIMKGIAAGRIVITKNIEKDIRAIGIGEGLRIKINSNIGTSEDLENLELELEKARVSEKYGADTLMDLSTGGNLELIRQKIVNSISIPLGTVPIYQAAVKSVNET